MGADRRQDHALRLRHRDGWNNLGNRKVLKEKNPQIKVIGADPFGSIYKTYKDTGTIPETTPYLVEGIGQEVLPANAHMQ